MNNVYILSPKGKIFVENPDEIFQKISELYPLLKKINIEQPNVMGVRFDSGFKAPDKAEILKIITENNLLKKGYLNHYEWLNENLNDFWLKVFGKSLEEDGFNNIISSHGDKAYCYKRKWELASVPFYHGVALFLLSYTELFDNESDVSDWVIKNYPKYKEFLN